MRDTKIVVSDQQKRSFSGPLAVVFADKQGNVPALLGKKLRRELKTFIELGDFKGKAAECSVLYRDRPAKGKDEQLDSPRLLLAGIGARDEEHSLLLENLRRAGGAVASQAARTKSEEILLIVPEFLDLPAHGAEWLLEGILLGDYRFSKYKKPSEDEPEFKGIRRLVIWTEGNAAAVRRAAKRARLSARAVRCARDMANEPGNRWTPSHFAEFAKSLADTSGLTCTVMNKEQIRKQGMGGIIAVNQGSAVPPRLVILDHKPKNYSQTLLLVGKGLTFDSGGISIKPAAGMQDMKYDMCGGAAVLATMMVVAEERPPLRVVAVVPATENMSGSRALKPGDIIEHYNGISSEIINTDAEGRLILADALAYGIETFKPDGIIDLATLTGSVIIALGHHRTGMVSNHDGLADFVVESGAQCGEPIWRLPLDKDYVKQLDSEVADLKNIGGKEGGTITAAAYLQKFVGEVPWVHLDIAGTAWNFTKKEYIPKGPSGVGVRTLIALIRNWKNPGL